jgi:signal transduction histidine kinase
MALVIFALGTCLFYWSLRRIMGEDASEKLQLEAVQVSAKLNHLGKVPEQFISAGDKIFIEPGPMSAGASGLHDTTVYDKEEQEELHYRTLCFPFVLNNQAYRITITRPLFESDDLISTTVKSMLFIVLGLLAGILLINRWISRKLWRPFYKTLEQLKTYSIDGPKLAAFRPSGIVEFDELNVTLEKMTDKISSDYLSLKDFSENASHEIQTPLAIVKSKLEMLIQSPGLSESQIKLISDIYEGSNRLSKLNQALILLTRIGNNQFSETKAIRVSELVSNKLKSFDELISHKELQVNEDLNNSVVVHLHPILADILISNILGNAIKHNVRGGKIDIRLTEQALSLSNTGEVLEADPEKLFERFKKGNAAADSLGLGLALVRQICDSSGIRVSYQYEEQVHTISLKFTA